ncbi:MAG TPA: ribosome silencing factor, partial [Caldithrix sp.]|nr:ribosome silencing factor [Caldithrix sp.]
MTSAQIAEKIAKLGWQKKGQDIAILDLKNLTDVSDYFV